MTQEVEEALLAQTMHEAATSLEDAVRIENAGRVKRLLYDRRSKM